MVFQFQKDHPFEKRKKVSTEMLNKYPERLPIIVEPSPSISKSKKNLYKKILAPNELKFNEFLGTIRKNLNIDSSVGFYVFLNNDTVPAPLQILGELYKNHKDEDGFLYMSYNFENTFG